MKYKSREPIVPPVLAPVERLSEQLTSLCMSIEQEAKRTGLHPSRVVVFVYFRNKNLDAYRCALLFESLSTCSSCRFADLSKRCAMCNSVSSRRFSWTKRCNRSASEFLVVSATRARGGCEESDRLRR